MTVGEFCNRKVVVTTRDTSIPEVAKLMREFHVGDIVIVDYKDEKPVPVGMVTDRDIVLQVIAKEVAVDTLLVDDIMSLELMSVRESDPIWETLKLIRTKGIRRVPVLSKEGFLVGIIAIDDMLELVLEEMNDLVFAITREQMKEKKLRK